MRIDAGSVAQGGWAHWRRDSAVLLPLVGATLFLPRWAVQLLVPPWPVPAAGDASEAAMLAWSEAFAAWAGSYGVWHIAAVLLGLWGALAITALYADRQRPTLGRALGRSLGLLPRYVLASALVGLPLAGLLGVAMLQPLLLIVLVAPLFYVSARTLLVAPVLVAEAPVSAVGAILRSWRLTRGAGWTLAWLIAVLMLAVTVAAGVFAGIGGLGTAAAPPNPVLLAFATAAATVCAAAGTLASTLLAVSAYTRLASSGT